MTQDKIRQASEMGAREMTLKEFVETLYPGHRVRKEYEALADLARPSSTPEKGDKGQNPHREDAANALSWFQKNGLTMDSYFYTGILIDFVKHELQTTPPQDVASTEGENNSTHRKELK